MSSLTRRQHGRAGPGPLTRVDRIVEEWRRLLPTRRLGFDRPGEEVIRVDEYREGDTQVIRAELPGIDPEKDVDLTVTDGMLRIRAERRSEQKTEEKGYLRRELRYGSMTRTLRLPEGVSASAITATYRDGILEIRVPVPERRQKAPTRISVSKG